MQSSALQILRLTGTAFTDIIIGLLNQTGLVSFEPVEASAPTHQWHGLQINK